MIKRIPFLVMFAFGVLSGCRTTSSGQYRTTTEAPKDVIKGKIFATANLEPRSGSTAQGTAWFSKANEDIHIVVFVDGADPGVHGIHIHEKGDCSAADATSAGDHFNPTHLIHGSFDPLRFHVGDLGNITIHENGNGVLNLVIPSAHFNPDFADWSHVIGKSIVLHNKADNFISQPSGDSGSRIACGVIKA